MGGDGVEFADLLAWPILHDARDRAGFHKQTDEAGDGDWVSKGHAEAAQARLGQSRMQAPPSRLGPTGGRSPTPGLTAVTPAI